MKACDEFSDHLQAYLDGELASEKARALEAHISRCAECRELVSDLKKVMGLLRSIPEVPVRTDFSKRVVDNIPHRRYRRAPFPMKALKCAAGFLLVCGIAAIIYVTVAFTQAPAVHRELAQSPEARIVPSYDKAKRGRVQ